MYLVNDRKKPLNSVIPLGKIKILALYLFA